jgi:hypothetical protein
MSGSVLELLEQARVALDGARAVELADLSDEELCALTERTEQVGRLVDSARVRSAGELENRSRFELGSDGLAFRLGQRRASQLIEVITLVPASEANRRVRLGTAIRAGHTLQGAELPSPFPHILKALHAGVIDSTAAATIVRCIGQAIAHGADPELARDAEEALVNSALREPADNVAVMARAWREALDPDGSEPREEQLRAQRGLTIGREVEGMTRFWGACDPASAAQLRAALAASPSRDAEPRFLSEADLPGTSRSRTGIFPRASTTHAPCSNVNWMCCSDYSRPGCAPPSKAAWPP